MSSARKRRPERATRLAGLSGFLTRRPRLVFFSWLLVVVILALLGRNLAGQLQPHPLFIGGSEPKLAHEITLRQFGSDESMVVALRGPRAAVARQGRELDARVDALPKTVVVSPWSAGGAAIGGLRPEPGVAGLVVRVGHRSDQGFEEMLELVEGEVERTVAPPVHASIAGLPRIFSSYSDANESAAKTGEMIAIPVLLIVLLLVFRSIVAALIPVVVGGIVVAATDGVLRLLLGLIEVDAFALAAAGMMGLALGIDYSLLVVSRFREERGKADLAEAVQITVQATARSVIPAACGLSLAMLIAAQILPGAVVTSAALAIVIATVFSAFSALTAVPAAIMLLGRNLDRWSLPERYSVSGVPLRVSSRIARRPAAVGLIVLVMLFLAGWSTTLKSSLASPELLPPGDAGRVEEERVENALGPGWLAPIEIVLRGHGEPMTSPKKIRSLVAFQDQLERDPGVETVAGFNTIAHNLKPLSGFERRLVDQQRGATKLASGIARTDRGAQLNSSGLHAAAAGAGELGHGVESTTYGADLLVRGLRASNTGSNQLTAGLERASQGSGRVAASSSATSRGARRLAQALEEAHEQVNESAGNMRSTKSALHSGNDSLVEARGPLQTAEERLAAAWQALGQMTTGTADPQYSTLKRALREASANLTGVDPEGGKLLAPPYEGVRAANTHAEREFGLALYLAEKIGEANSEAGESTGELAKSSRRLDRGIRSLAEGASKMSAGVNELAAEGSQLSPALQRLQAGTEHLAQGLGRLAGSASGLSGGLGGGASGADRLAQALGDLGAHLESSPAGSKSALDRLRKRAPNLFNSGYFYLAGLDGSDASKRSLANFMIDLDSGGQTARMMVIPRHPITTDAGMETFDRVRGDAREFATTSGNQAVVGGLTASQVVIDHTLRDRTALARIAMMLVTLLILIPVLRSFTIPVLAAFLNLLTVSASLGIVSLLFNGSLLGGPGFVDSSDIPATIMVIFGLAIDYEVFVFARIREEYVRTGSTTEAVDNGIARTAPVVTGAAVIMIAVFLCFSVSEFVTLRNFGVAQATAVFIDAFIVRLIIVPAAMKGFGRWSWWMPKWLDRLLPGGEPVRAEPSEV